MVPPTLKPTTYAQMLERHHADPPALWFTNIVGSLLIHLLAFGVLRLLLMGASQDLQPNKTLIPVNLIAVAPKAISSTQVTQQPSTTTPNNPTGVNSPIKRTTNPSNPSATRANNQPTSRSPISPQNQPSTKPIQKPAVKVSPSSNRKSPVANSSGKQQPKPQPSSSKPVSPTNSTTNKPSPSPTNSPKPHSAPSNSPKPHPAPSNSPKPSPSPTNSPKPSPSPTKGTPTKPNSGSFIITTGGLTLIPTRGDILHPNDPEYNDKLATLIDGGRQLSAEELKQLGITLDRALELRVGVLVETNGTATVLPNTTKVLSGNISADAAEKLAKNIVQQWKFQPTLMAGKPVLRGYYIPITISPAKK